MSRLAAKPIPLEKTVQITVNDELMIAKGPKGELQVRMHPEIEVLVEDGQISVRSKPDIKDKAKLGLVFSLVRNAVIGVTSGFSKKMTIDGKGWRSAINGNVINLQVGYSHPVNFTLPEGVTAVAENPGVFVVHSHDKQLLGQVCADIQKIRPVEPYKLKGIKIEGQYIRQKARKAAGA